METSQQEILKLARAKMIEKFQGEGTGHDWHHINRVSRLAVNLATKENADTYITEIAALLHDIADHKFYDGDLTEGPRKAELFLREIGARQETVLAVKKIVEEVSFKGAGVETPVSSKESACVQDADRIDALGAIGIGRTFAYGGSVGNPMYEPDLEPEMHSSFERYSSSQGTTINHFYEKLLLLKDRMNTDAGTEIAVERHNYMTQFLERFYQEWEGEA